MTATPPRHLSARASSPRDPSAPAARASSPRDQSAPLSRASSSRRPPAPPPRASSPRHPNAPPPRASSPRPTTGSARGQASVEVIALLPLGAAIALAAITIASSSVAQEQAGEAAEAAALAILQDTGDPKAAAQKALSRSARRRASIQVSGRRVRVRVRSAFSLPGLADRLAGVARADAGP